ncbi:MAG: glycine oxidase ThiO [bacterium]
MNKSDVIVIGAGIAGLGIARELAGRGVKVTLLERGLPGQEASWASAGMLAPQGELSEGDFLHLCLASNALYPEYREKIEAETGLRTYHRDAATLAVAMTEEDEREFRHTYEGQRAEGLQVEWLSGDEARKLEPALSENARGGMYLPGDKHIENRLLVPALEQSCRELGVTIVPGAQVYRVISTAGKASGVETILGTFHANHIINAAGSWSANIDVPDEALRPPVFPVRGQMLAIILPRPGFIGRTVRSPRSYLIPRHNARLFLGATMEQVGFDKRNTIWAINRLLNGALELFPELEQSAIIEMWAGLRPGSKDNHPILGSTSLPGYILATGLFRNGLLLGPIIAKTIADLVTTGEEDILIKPFNISRFDGEVTVGRIPGA